LASDRVHGNELSGSIQGREFLDELGDFQDHSDLQLQLCMKSLLYSFALSQRINCTVKAMGCGIRADIR
jgi:hypothetical protein